MREPVTTTVSTLSALAVPTRLSADAVAAPSIKAARKLELFRRNILEAPSAEFFLRRLETVLRKVQVVISRKCTTALTLRPISTYNVRIFGLSVKMQLAYAVIRRRIVAFWVHAF